MSQIENKSNCIVECAKLSVELLNIERRKEAIMQRVQQLANFIEIYEKAEQGNDKKPE